MSNVLDEEKQRQILGLGPLGWTLRRIEAATGVRGEAGRANRHIVVGYLEDEAHQRFVVRDVGLKRVVQQGA
jgi:hypothetical protein